MSPLLVSCGFMKVSQPHGSRVTLENVTGDSRFDPLFNARENITRINHLLYIHEDRSLLSKMTPYLAT